MKTFRVNRCGEAEWFDVQANTTKEAVENWYNVSVYTYALREAYYSRGKPIGVEIFSDTLDNNMFCAWEVPNES